MVSLRLRCRLCNNHLHCPAADGRARRKCASDSDTRPIRRHRSCRASSADAVPLSCSSSRPHQPGRLPRAYFSETLNSFSRRWLWCVASEAKLAGRLLDISTIRCPPPLSYSPPLIERARRLANAGQYCVDYPLRHFAAQWRVTSRCLKQSNLLPPRSRRFLAASFSSGNYKQ